MNLSENYMSPLWGSKLVAGPLYPQLALRATNIATRFAGW
jgi:hypothetical protein